eukprot:755608-Hanusia_phi.AAC.2
MQLLRPGVIYRAHRPARTVEDLISLHPSHPLGPPLAEPACPSNELLVIIINQNDDRFARRQLVPELEEVAFRWQSSLCVKAFSRDAQDVQQDVVSRDAQDVQQDVVRCLASLLLYDTGQVERSLLVSVNPFQSLLHLSRSLN